MVVLDALRQLHAKGKGREVTRAAVVAAVNLPASTVDDRLRALVRAGEVHRQRQGRYVPKPLPGQRLLRPLPSGAVKATVLPDGGVIIEVGEQRLELHPEELKKVVQLLAGKP